MYFEFKDGWNSQFIKLILWILELNSELQLLCKESSWNWVEIKVLDWIPARILNRFKVGRTSALDW